MASSRPLAANTHGIRRSRSRTRRYSDAASSSSASTSPERGAIDDDNDSILIPDDDESVSSLAPSVDEEELSDSAAQELAERIRLSPISRLPAELMISIFQKLGSTADLKNCMLVSKEWARNSVGLLWHRPTTGNWGSLQCVVQSLRSAHAAFDYPHLVKRLNLSSLGSQVSDGVLQPFQDCKRIERLTLTGCRQLTDLSLVKMVTNNRSLLALDVTAVQGVTDVTMDAVATHCYRLQGLNITLCSKISDDSLVLIARNCRHLKRLKFNDCRHLTAKSIVEFARHCRQLLEIDLHNCALIEDDAVTALISEGQQLRELRLAHCQRITDGAFLSLPYDQTYDTLRILDLTDCGELQDAGVIRAISAAPRLRNLVLAKCRQITDRAVQAITKLGKNLHYIHLGHCARITDAGVLQLIRICSRIRYIDLACCTNLTDASITALSSLPKLKRIGLVKCNNITDRSIFALAKPRPSELPRGGTQPSALERVHLSYCTQLTVVGVTALLNNCPRLTHLSLTGVQAFLHEEFTAFCREAPPEFNDHQRDVFCVFSNHGVTRLRDHLNLDPNNRVYEPQPEQPEFFDQDMSGADFSQNITAHPVLLPNGPPTVLLPQFMPPPSAQIPAAAGIALPSAQGEAASGNPTHQQTLFTLPPFGTLTQNLMAGTTSASRPELPPLLIPTANPGSMNDAPLTIDDDDVQYGSDDEAMPGPA